MTTSHPPDGGDGGRSEHPRDETGDAARPHDPSGVLRAGALPASDDASGARVTEVRATDVRDEEPPRGSLGLLLDPTFGPFFAGKLLSSTGVWTHNIAAAILVYQLTSSTLLVGLISVVQFLPQMLFAPYSGARADRTADRRRQMIVGRAITALGAALPAVVLATGAADAQLRVVVVIASAGVVGVGFAVGGPAMQAILPALVRPRELPGAVALDMLPFTVARTVGPAIGALLVVSLGHIAAFTFSSAAATIYVLILLRIRIRPVPRAQPRDGSVRGGLRHLKVDRGLPLLLAGIAAIGIAVDPVITLGPAIADELGGDAGVVGMLASAFGFGAGATFLILGRLRGRLGIPRLTSVGLGLMAVGMSALALRPSVGAAVASLVVAGSGLTMGFTALSTQVQQRVPEELRGRIMALWSVAFIGSRPLAAATNSSIAEFVAINASLAFVVAVLVAALVATRPRRVARWTP